MSGISSVVTKTGNTHKIAQPEPLITYADRRSWQLHDGKGSLGFTDLNEVVKTGDDGKVAGTSPAIASSANFTMCIDRSETYAYIMCTYFSNQVTLAKLNISTMLFDFKDQEIVTPGIAPLRAIISADEKIWWLGDNSTLYKMDLDGGNLENISLGTTQTAEMSHTFCMDSNYAYAVTQRTSGLLRTHRIKLSDMSLETYSTYDYAQRKAVDSFVLNGSIYLLTQRYVSAPSITYPDIIFKIPVATWDDKLTYVINDIVTAYGVELLSTAQFNASGADNYATFSCTIGTRQTVMQCNLDTLDCLPARRVNYAEREIEYSNDAGKEIEKLGIDITKANNCDWKGLLTSSAGATGSI